MDEVDRFLNTIKRLCKHCQHPVRIAIEFGSLVEPLKPYHYNDGYGSKACEFCPCMDPEPERIEDHDQYEVAQRYGLSR